MEFMIQPFEAGLELTDISGWRLPDLICITINLNCPKCYTNQRTSCACNPH